MRNLIMICIMTLSIVSVSNAQETSKANRALKLVQKGDLRGAINIFTDILKEDPSQKDVLLMRAKAKYKAGAYQGTLNDCFAYMEKHGIDDEVAGLLGKTQLAKGNYKQALAYLKVALLFNPSGEEYLLDRGQAYYDLGLDQEACDDWYTAAIDGSMNGKRMSEKYCRNFRKKNNPPKVDKPKETDNTNSDTASNQNDSSSSSSSNDSNDDVADNTKKDKPKKDVPASGNNSNNDSNTESNSNSTDTSSDSNSDSSDNGSDILVDDTSYEDEYPIDTKVNKIYIDEDLTIKIGNGIGSREVKETPEMLIFSDYNGEVVVDICVNRIGKVVKSQLNETKSTIKTKSLVSLALRKSEEFWFARTDRKEQCGTITFVIRAGNDE